MLCAIMTKQLGLFTQFLLSQNKKVQKLDNLKAHFTFSHQPRYGHFSRRPRNIKAFLKKQGGDFNLGQSGIKNLAYFNFQKIFSQNGRTFLKITHN